MMQQATVALRKESVDRNSAMLPSSVKMYQSLSARRAWIEISYWYSGHIHKRGRSPQGERG